ncbi:MAG: DNA primase, partial [Burkholderiales bacterium]|nr:DNA primase [Burkholderiales bacterium]
MIPEDFIQTLLARVDIVDVIDKRVPLKKAGANYVACCPFHQEKTPSFSVSPSKQFYHCFGCGAHGTAIRFLMEHGTQSFPEAVETLAQEIGLTVPHVDENKAVYANRKHAPDHVETMVTAANFYKKELKTSELAINYLKQRGLTGEIARRFGIGYAPDGRQPLKAAFPDYDAEALETLGLVIQKEDGSRYDRFRHRVMFPITDSRGKVIGFGGRVIGQGEPKYLNSPETPLFSKGRELYGLYEAREFIRQAGAVIVVEGYMDVVALAQHGVNHCVATLGTATTSVHAQKLFRLTDHVIFCFDGDTAGKKAAWRALVNTLPTLKDDKRASFLFLPDELDPDEFIRSRGHDAFLDAVKNAKPLSDFLLDHQAERFPPDESDENRAAFIDLVLPLITEIADAPALKALMLKRVSSMTGLSDRELSAFLPQSGAQQHPASPRFKGSPRWQNVKTHYAQRRTRSDSLYSEILRAILQDPNLAIKHDLPPIDDKTSDAVALVEVAAYCRSLKTPPSTSLLIQHFDDTPYGHSIKKLSGLNLDQPIA